MNTAQKSYPYPIQIKALDQAQGIAEFIVSVFGNEDEQGDIVVAGAFQKAISSQLRSPKFAPDHDWSVDKRLGRVLDWKELKEGLWIRAQFNTEKQIAKDVLSDFIFDPEGQEFSFSYEVADGGAEVVKGKRYLREFAEVLDVGPVGIGANRSTHLVSVKAGRTLSTKNEQTLREARELLDQVLSQLEEADAAKANAEEPERANAEEPHRGRVALFEAEMTALEALSS